MSEENPQDKIPEGSQSKEGEPSALVPKPDSPLEGKLEELVKALSEQNLSPPQKERIVQTFREVFTTYIERSAGPKMDPEMFKIAADAVCQEQDNRFKFLTQKEQNAAAKSEREDALEKIKHQDRFKILRPIIFIAVTVFTVSLFIGIYLAATSHEILGSCIITAVITSFLSYLAGLGTSDLVKGK